MHRCSRLDVYTILLPIVLRVVVGRTHRNYYITIIIMTEHHVYNPPIGKLDEIIFYYYTWAPSSYYIIIII